MPRIRLVTLDDVPALTDLLRANLEFLRPWEPTRDDAYFTIDGQHEIISTALQGHDAGTLMPYVVLNDSRDVVGRITLNNIARGPLQSAVLGYWVDETHNGIGLASAAVHTMLVVAFDELQLHRLEAGTLLDNVGSQRVLERNGFERYGVAREFMLIDGRWQDNAMYQLLTPHDV